MAFVSTRSLALALPLVLGLACTHTRSSTASAGGPDRSAATDPTRSVEGGALAANPDDTAGAAAQGRSAIAPHSDDQILSGRVARISSDSIAIDDAQGSQRTLGIVPQTIFVVDGRDATLADIQEGQEVRASYNTLEDREVAVKVEAGANAGAAGKDYGPGAPSGIQSQPSTTGAGPGGSPGSGMSQPPTEKQRR